MFNHKELAENYGSATLIIAAIMRHTGCSEEEATDHYWSTWIAFDELMERGLVEYPADDEDDE